VSTAERCPGVPPGSAPGTRAGAALKAASKSGSATPAAAWEASWAAARRRVASPFHGGTLPAGLTDRLTNPFGAALLPVRRPFLAEADQGCIPIYRQFALHL
jgi:hypothetical protein